MQALSIRGLTKTYANGVQALRGIDLDVAEGDFFALLGPNGAGKTTTIGIIVSLVDKSGGTVSVFGHDIDRELDRAKSCIGLVPQEINFNQFEKVFTIIVNQAGFYGIPRALAVERSEKYLKQLQLWDKRDTIARSLSGGMKRRLMIARALVHEPRLLILDEPTAGVDIEIRRSMWGFLREHQRARHDDHPDDALPRGGGKPLPPHRDHRRRPDHRERHDVGRDTQALPGDLRAELPLRDRRRAAAAGLRDQAGGRPHDRGRRHAQEQGLNDIFARLSQQGIEVVSMRNKVNRLEELFMRLVERRDAPSAEAR